MSTDSRRARGVSPVIGVLLMAAITVILAAIIGNFVLGMGNDVEGNIQAGANIQHDASVDQIEATWTSNKNAETVTVKFKESGTGTAVDKQTTLSSVGSVTTYTCSSDGADVRVVVVAKAGGITSVVQDKRIENC